MANFPQGATRDYQTTAYAASGVIKATPGRLYKLWGYNSGPAQFFQLCDAASVPANATVPKVTFAIAAASNFEFDLQDVGRQFLVGITWNNSSTGQTKTLGAADCWVNAIIQ